MKNARMIFWLTVATLLALSANFALDTYSPKIRSVGSDSLVAPAFNPVTIVVRRSDRRPVVLKKSSEWRIVEPFFGNADNRVVMKLIDAVQLTPIEDRVTEAELARLGRTKADFIPFPSPLSLDFDDGRKKICVSFGGYTPSSNGVYAAVGELGDVSVVPATVFTSAWLEVDALRQRVLFDFTPESVASFDIKQKAGEVQSFTRAGGAWRIGEKSASSARVKEFVSLFTSAVADAFVWPVGGSNETEVISTSLLSGYGLDSESALSVTFRCIGGDENRISLGNLAGEKRVYALIRNGREIVKVDASLKDAALQSSSRMSDSRIFPIDYGSVRSIAIVDGETSYVLSADDSGVWRMDSPIVALADADTVKSVVRRILGLSHSDVSGGGVSISVNSGGTLAMVSKTKILGSKRLVDFRSKVMMTVDPKKVKRISVLKKDSSRAVSVVYSGDRRSWNVESSARSGVVDSAAVAGLLKKINLLKAVRTVALKATQSELSKYGLENPCYKVAIDQTTEGSVRKNILIGHKTDGGHFATIGAADAIFVISDETVKVLTAELIGD